MPRNRLTEVPTPKYRVGQRVFYPYTQTHSVEADCPDCLGQKEWRVCTPAGETIAVGCGTCDGRGKVTTPTRHHVGYTKQMTVGSIKIDTGDVPDDGDSGSYRWPVCYMCEETGVGSGSVYTERRLCETEAEAVEMADDMARTSNLEAKKEEVKAHGGVRDGHLRIVDDAYHAARQLVWDGYWQLRRLTENLRGLVDDDRASWAGNTAEHLAGLVAEAMDDAVRYTARYTARGPLEKMIELVDELSAVLAVDARRETSTTTGLATERVDAATDVLDDVRAVAAKLAAARAPFGTVMQPKPYPWEHPSRGRAVL